MLAQMKLQPNYPCYIVKRMHNNLGVADFDLIEEGGLNGFLDAYLEGYRKNYVFKNSDGAMLYLVEAKSVRDGVKQKYVRLANGDALLACGGSVPIYINANEFKEVYDTFDNSKHSTFNWENYSKWFVIYKKRDPFTEVQFLAYLDFLTLSDKCICYFDSPEKAKSASESFRDMYYSRYGREGLARLNQYEVEIAEEYPFKREGVKKVHFNIEYGGGW